MDINDRCNDCKICNKSYASYKSLWTHNKRFHKNTEEYLGLDKNIDDKIENKIITEDNNNKDNSNIIYKFKASTLGKNKYKGNNGGDIYIIQTEFNLKGFYKIGVSTNLYKKLEQYKPDTTLEPKLHYYYSCKNINEANVILKNKLLKFNIKKDIYKIDDLNELRNIIKKIQKEMLSDVIEIEPEIKECAIVNCDHCEMFFTNKLDKQIHIKQEHNDTNNEIIPSKLVEKLEELEKEIKILKDEKGKPNINNGNINNGTVNNIVINNYDKDNMDYITDKFKQKILSMIPNDQVNVIPKLLENIKFNSNHKENNNFKINSDRSKICFKFKDNQWISDNKNKSLNELLDYGNKIVKQFYEEGIEVLDDEKKEEYHNFQDKIFKKLKKQVDKQNKKDNILRNQIMKEIENIAYTYTKNNK